ncbi:hypothetical protein [Pelagimonas phthalicica]|uniref:hypothetical protein n=1 Tax=Pelagimonas phthalicica TaxID=1037362 RepID=UPI00105FC2DF|nr:hypothetical protein [Pelagimonas phthalicica]
MAKIESELLPQLSSTTQKRTIQPFAHAAIADAAFARAWRMFVAAMSCKSPKQSLQGVDLMETETKLSPQADPTTQSRTLLSLRNFRENGS